MAIDTASGIPARVRLVGIVNLHCNDIISSFQIFRNIILETRIAIRTMPHFLSVDIDCRVHIYSIKLDKVTTTGLRFTIEEKVFPVPADTTRQSTTASTAGITSIKIAFNCPVVGKAKLSPVVVIIRRGGHLSRIAQNEQPTFIKIITLSGLHRQGDSHQGYTKEKQSFHKNMLYVMDEWEFLLQNEHQDLHSWCRGGPFRPIGLPWCDLKAVRDPHPP